MGLVEKLGMVIHPVEDLEEALAFYRDALGLAVAFRDGDRFCALDAGGATVALAAGAERLCDRAVVSYEVADLPGAVTALERAGARVLRPVERGPHEQRAVLEDPAGNPFVLYAR